MFFLREITRGKMKFKKAIVLMVLSMICFGLIIEVMQYMFTLNRRGDFLDGLANSVGATCGAGVVKYLFSERRKLKWKF